MKTLFLLLFVTLTWGQNVPHEHQLVYKFAHLKGNADSSNANGDFSLTAKDTFVLVPPNSEQWILNGFTVTIIDSLTSKSDVYGGDVALDTGIAIQKNQGTSMLYSLTNGDKIKKNEDWGKVSCDVKYETFNASDDYIRVNWCFMKTGQSMLLDGTKSDSLFIILNDDLSSLSGHFFFFRGYNKSSRP